MLIDGDTIAALSEGTIDSGVPSNTTRVNATGKIISPGFIDTHTVSLNTTAQLLLY